MTTLVKIQRKGQMTLPSSFRQAMGVAEGSLVELPIKDIKPNPFQPRQTVDPAALEECFWRQAGHDCLKCGWLVRVSMDGLL